MTQLQLKRAPSTEPALHCLGIPASETVPQLQKDAYKELVNKLAWAVGSSYGAPYNNMRTQARVTANELAASLILAHGYPRQILLTHKK